MLFLLLAYLGGVLTIASPCILPVLPFVFARADQPFVRSGLPMLAANKAAMALDQAAFREAFAAEFVATAGLTWEQASSKYGK